MRFKRNIRRFTVEYHRYAPELCGLWVGRTKIKVEGRTLQQMMDAIGWTQGHPMIHATIKATYPEEWRRLNRVISGTVTDRQQAIDMARKIRERESCGDRKLADGRTLPIPQVTVKTKLVWL